MPRLSILPLLLSARLSPSLMAADSLTPAANGVSLWLAAEARKRNPAIVLDALP